MFGESRGEEPESPDVFLILVRLCDLEEINVLVTEIETGGEDRESFRP